MIKVTTINVVPVLLFSSNLANTAELSDVVESLCFCSFSVTHNRPLMRTWSRAITRTNVCLGLTNQQLLSEVQLHIRLTLCRIQGQGGNAGSECLDHAGELGSQGLVSSHNVNTR